jgi:hypothetical protein
MIVRSGADLNTLLEAIVDTNILGPCDEEEFSMFKLVHPDAEKQEKHERDREGSENPDGTIPPSDNMFGFWLPHGLSSDPQMRAAEIVSCMQRFDQIEDAFCMVEGEEEVREIIGRR